MDRRLLIAATALVLLASGCYAPDLERCTVRCSTSRTCPDGFSCGADDFCHEPGDPNCGGGGADARIDAALDAGDAAGDAGSDAGSDAAP